MFSTQELTKECAELSQLLVATRDQQAREVGAWEARLEEARNGARDLQRQLEAAGQEAALAAIAEQQRLAHAIEERQHQEEVRQFCRGVQFKVHTLPLISAFLFAPRSRRSLRPTRGR